MPAAMLCAGAVAVHLSLGVAGSALAQSALSDDQLRTSNQAAADPIPATDGELPDAVADDTANDGALTTGGIDPSIVNPSDILDQQNMQELRRQNMRESTVDGPRLRTNGDTDGIRLGSFILRPSITETLGAERTTIGGKSTTRTYIRSGAKASLTSDWSLHQLRIDAEGSWDKSLSGVQEGDPEGGIQAELRLDLSDQTTATLKAGYSLRREDIGDPNAVANAITQSDVHGYTASADVTRDLGVFRTTAGLEFTRQVYSDVTLADGQRLSQSERDNKTGRIRGRLGYELSPALIPFLEASYGRSLYDEHRDTLGYVRDANFYAMKAGIEADFGEKLKGELAGGYLLADFDDKALQSISAATIDGNAVWSPYRGTNVALNLRTEIEPTTTPGASGSTAYTGTMVLSQVILENITGQVAGGLTLRDYSTEGMPVQSVLTLGTGLTWGISRSIDFNADLAWEKTRQDGAASLEILRAGIGLTLKR